MNSDFGSEAICSGCAFGKIVRVKSMPNPETVWNFRRENPGCGADPPSYYVQLRYCTHPVLAGVNAGGGTEYAREMGVVVSRELFKARDL